MVAKLNLPAFDSLEVVKNVISERVHYKDFYKTLEDDWKRIILSYIENSADPQFVKPLDLMAYLSQESVNTEAKVPAEKNESDDPKVCSGIVNLATH